MAKSFFTIVIPTLNEEKHLPDILTDLQKQSYKDFDIVVVDGKSEDKTADIAKKFKTKLILSSKRNVSFQRNLGGNAAKSPFIIFMDADNRLPKTFISKIKKYIEEENPDILSTWMKPNTRSNKDRLTATIMNIFMDIYKNTKKPYVLESMIVINKNNFKKLKGFDPKISWREGEDLLEKAKKLGMNFDFIKWPKYTYSFRRFRKVGAFKMLQEMSQMEIIKMLKGSLSQQETEILYPMLGGKFYGKMGEKKNLDLKKFISILFE